jgi:hypothetical protein
MRLLDPKLSVSPEMANYCAYKLIVDGSDHANLQAGYSRTIANGLIPAGQEQRKEVDEQLGCHLLIVCRIGGAPTMDRSELCMSVVSPTCQVVLASSVR